MQSDCKNSSEKPKQTCLKETNKQTSQAMGLVEAPQSLNTSYRVPFLLILTHTWHVMSAQLISASSSFMTMLICEIPFVCKDM